MQKFLKEVINLSTETETKGFWTIEVPHASDIKIIPRNREAGVGGPFCSENQIKHVHSLTNSSKIKEHAPTKISVQ